MNTSYWSGKPRSAETKIKISQSLKGTNVGSANPSHGSFWITDGENEMKCNGTIPGGWQKGRKRKASRDAWSPEYRAEVRKKMAESQKSRNQKLSNS